MEAVPSQVFVVDCQTFLNGVFHGMSDKDFYWLAKFEEDPEKAADPEWVGGPIALDYGLKGSNEHNMYVALSSFKSKKSRSKSNFSKLHFIVLDDVGEKVSYEEVFSKLEPSYVLQTSKNSYQFGYVLDTPCGDYNKADRFVRAMVKTGNVGDRGGQNVIRYVRIPNSVNTKKKYGKPWKVLTRHWNPESRYSIDQICEAFGADMDAVTSKAPTGTKHLRFNPEDDAILKWLDEKGYLRSTEPDDKGFYLLMCPFENHSSQTLDSTKSDTVYAQHTVDDLGIPTPHRVFNCQHDKCHQRTITDLIELVEADGVDLGPEEYERPRIQYRPGDIHSVAEEVVEVMKPSERLFNRGNALVKVTIVDRERAEADKKKSTPTASPFGKGTVRKLHAPRQEGTYIVSMCIPDSIYLTVSRFVNLFKIKMRDEEIEEVDIDPPRNVLSAICNDKDLLAKFDVLNGVTDLPIIQKDGSFSTKPGYDKDTGWFYVSRRSSPYKVPDKVPGKAEAKAALDELRDIFRYRCEEGSYRGIPFREECDEAAFIAILLSAVAAPWLKERPLVVITGPASGTGKTYAAFVLTSFIEGTEMSTVSFFPREEEEMKKTLVAIGLSAARTVVFDNLEDGSNIFSEALCAAATTGSISGRILGQTSNLEARNSTQFFLTGNNIRSNKDMMRRSVTIHLDAKQDVPSIRTFSVDLVKYVVENRERIFGLCATIISQYVNRIDSVKDAQFGNWSVLCSRPLRDLGMADPLDERKKLLIAEHRSSIIVNFLRLICEEIGAEKYFRASDIMKMGIDTYSGRPFDTHMGEMVSAIAEESGLDVSKWNDHRMGHWLKKHVGTTSDSFILACRKFGVATQYWVHNTMLD